MNLRILLLPLLIVASLSVSFADEQTDQAVAAAKAWLALVDAKDYAKSWDAAAPFFKKSVTEDGWVKMVAPVRDPLGAVKSRELIGAQYTTTLPGAPAGEYVVMQFKTAFQNRPEAVETVTPMKDDQGVWKVSGYFIK